MAGVASLMLATSVSAGASSITGKYNAMDAKLVPVGVQGKDLAGRDRRHVRAGRVHERAATMVGFDVDLMDAVAKTLGVTVKENNVTFDSILARHRVPAGTRSATRRSPTRRAERSR